MDSQILLAVLGLSSLLLLVALMILIILKIRKRDEMSTARARHKRQSPVSRTAQGTGNGPRKLPIAAEIVSSGAAGEKYDNYDNYDAKELIEAYHDDPEIAMKQLMISTSCQNPDVIPTKTDISSKYCLLSLSLSLPLSSLPLLSLCSLILASSGFRLTPISG